MVAEDTPPPKGNPKVTSMYKYGNVKSLIVLQSIQETKPATWHVTRIRIN